MDVQKLAELSEALEREVPAEGGWAELEYDEQNSVLAGDPRGLVRLATMILAAASGRTIDRTRLQQLFSASDPAISNIRLQEQRDTPTQTRSSAFVQGVVFIGCFALVLLAFGGFVGLVVRGGAALLDWRPPWCG